ncbi:MAG TPA: translesion DNA synthesis-associated protein ImuA [Rhodocyclaceae bacterium]|nr:translesion DNA synthesis-associated protein ImuA [Rhodocyclaceae bacterium]
MEAVSFAEVLARPDVWRGGHFADGGLPTVSSGFAALDAELPGGGWPRGAVTELLCDSAGCGEVSLLLPGLRGLCADDGWLLAVAPPYPLQAVAWAAAGIALARLLVVAPDAAHGTKKQAALDALWAAEQGLASDAPAAVLCWSSSADAKAVRRLQVAAAAGHSALFLVRPARAAQQSSAAPLRLQLEAGAEGRLSVRIFKRRGPPLSQPLHLAVPRPAKWRAHHGSSHGTSVARPAPAAPVPRRPSEFIGAAIAAQPAPLSP